MFYDHSHYYFYIYLKKKVILFNNKFFFFLFLNLKFFIKVYVNHVYQNYLFKKIQKIYQFESLFKETQNYFSFDLHRKL